MKSTNTMKPATMRLVRAIGCAGLLGTLSGCYAAPPPPPVAYAPAPVAYAAPGYYAAPVYPAYGYYAGPSVAVDIGRGRRW